MTRSVPRVVLVAVSAGAAVGILLRFGLLLQGPRSLLAAVLAAAAVAGLMLLPATQDPGPRWPAPPGPERVAGWHRVSVLATAMRTGRFDAAGRDRRGAGPRPREEDP